jgi:hypothetical protein
MGPPYGRAGGLEGRDRRPLRAGGEQGGTQPDDPTSEVLSIEPAVAQAAGRRSSSSTTLVPVRR